MSEEIVCDLLRLDSKNIMVYDNWDKPSSSLSLDEKGGRFACLITVTPITNIAYFEKGLLVALAHKVVTWNDFDAVRARLNSSVDADGVKFLIEEADGEHWVAVIEFKGANQDALYSAGNEQFKYGWGGAGVHQKDTPLKRLYVSVYRSQKPKENVRLDFSDVQLVKGPADAAPPPPLAWYFDRAKEGDALGWKPMVGLNVFKLGKGVLEMRMEQDYAYTAPQTVRLDAAKHRYLLIRLNATGQGGKGKLGMYFTTTEMKEMNEKAKCILPIACEGTTEDYVLDLGEVEAWRGTVTSFRLDFGLPAGTCIEISSIEFRETPGK